MTAPILDGLSKYQRYRRRHAAEIAARRPAQRRRHYAKHRESVLARNRAWQQANRDRLSAYLSLYAKINREKHNARGRAWKAANPEQVAAASHRRRVAGGAYTVIEWAALVASWGGCCAYCGKRRRLGPDHATPISRGGSNEIENIRPACLPV